jgi:hypothetical protein
MDAKPIRHAPRNLPCRRQFKAPEEIPMEALMIAALGLMLAALELRGSTPPATGEPAVVHRPRRDAVPKAELSRVRLLERETATHERRLAWLAKRRETESDPHLAARWDALLTLELDRHARRIDRLS